MTHDMADKTTHVDIVQNPDIKSFLDECNYMVPPTGNELAEIVSNFISVPFWDKALPTKIIAIDGSNYEATVNPQIPFTRFGFVKIGHLLINRDSYKGLNCGKFIDPFAVARLSEDNSSLLFSFPSSNMTYKEQKSVRNSFRLAMDEALYKQRFIESDPRTSIRTTLFYIAAHRTGKLHSDTPNRLFLHKCPTCEAEMIEVWDIPEVQKCPHCGERVYPSDCLRIWEEVHDSASNQLALTRFTNAIMHILIIHYIRYLKERFPNSYLGVLSNMCFFVDGPLAINGTAAWIKSCIQKCIYDVNVELKMANMSPMMVIGLQKSGKLYDYIHLIGSSIRPNSIYCVTDDFRNNYVDFDKTPSSTTYGNETYYGQDFLLKTSSGKLFVFNAPYPFPNKDNIAVFKKEKANIEHYFNIGAYVRLIEDFESDLYEGADVPIALAQKYTAISLQPGGKILDVLAQTAIKQ